MRKDWNFIVDETPYSCIHLLLKKERLNILAWNYYQIYLYHLILHIVLCMSTVILITFKLNNINPILSQSYSNLPSPFYSLLCTMLIHYQPLLICIGHCFFRFLWNILNLMMKYQSFPSTFCPSLNYPLNKTHPFKEWISI